MSHNNFNRFILNGKAAVALICGLLLSWSASAQDEIQISSIFSDNMVLQREMKVPVWGTGVSGETVTVNFNGQNKSSQIGNNGNWKIELDPMEASASPLEMVIKVGENSKTIKNILIGEVWLCSGQSNMEWAMHWGVVDNKKEEMANANFPNIRMINSRTRASGTPWSTTKATWQVCTPKSAGYFSCIGFFFGRDLHKTLDVPIGLIGANVGGTRIEPWTPAVGFELIPELKGIDKKVKGWNKEYAADTRKRLSEIKEWVKRAETSKDIMGSNIPQFPVHPLNAITDTKTKPTALYNAMLAPYVKYGIRGALWYQGESNLGDGSKYHKKMEALVAGWRKVWGQGDFPFYFCQIAPFKYGGKDKEQICSIWESQYKATETIKNCEMASTADIGNVNDIHPSNKQDVAKRLTLIALANTYKKTGVNWKNPAYSEKKLKGNELVIFFKNVADGLKSKDGKAVREFTIAGEDGIYHPADVKLHKRTIAISSPKVKSPKSVKYAWRNGAEPNLVNSAGLPVLPFKSAYNLYEGKKNCALNKPYKSSDHNSWGWNGGLTDGIVSSNQQNCFATSNTNKFPKNVVIDLEEAIDVKIVAVGVPNFGSTKTVEVSLSRDNSEFEKVQTLEFGQGKQTEKNVILAKPVNARYVKLTYLDKHNKQATFDPNFMFTTEVMVFSK